MVGMDEIGSGAADHFVLPIAQDGFATRADLSHRARRIHHQDQILRRLEDTAKLFGLLQERLLGAASFGDVANETVEQEPVAGPERRDAQLRCKYRSVAPLDLKFAAGLADLFLPRKQKAFQRRPQWSPRTRCAHQVEQVLAVGFLTGPSENGFGLRIPVPDDAALVDLDEGVDRGVDDAAGQLLALAQRLLDAVSL